MDEFKKSLPGNLAERNGDTVWIISYTPVCKEPRAIRQANTLHKQGFRVVVFGLNGPARCPPWWNFVPLADQPTLYRPSRRLALHVELFRENFLRFVRRCTQALVKANPTPSLTTLGARIYHRLTEGFECKRQTIRVYAAEIKSNRPELAPSLVLAHDYFTSDIAYQVSRQFGARFSVDCHEYSAAQYMQDLDWVTWHRPIVIALQAHYLQKAEAVTTVCDGIAELLNQDYKLKRPAVAIRSTPFFLEQFFRPVGNSITVLYHGEIYPSRGLHVAVHSLPLWREEFRLVLRGYSDPAYVEQLRQTATNLGVGHRLIIEEPVSFEQIIPSANRADIGYFVHEDISPQRRFVLPNKFFEYVMAGLALCVSDLPEMAKIVNQHKLGVLVSDCNPREIAKQINQFSRESIEAYKLNSLRAARRLNWSEEQKIMISLYQDVLK